MDPIIVELIVVVAIDVVIDVVVVVAADVVVDVVAKSTTRNSISNTSSIKWSMKLGSLNINSYIPSFCNLRITLLTLSSQGL